jgi:hypothetical protein
MTDRIRERVLGTAEDAGSDFAYENRREDEDLTVERLGEALHAETVTRSDIATAFVKGVTGAAGLVAEADRYEAVQPGVELVRAAFRSEVDDPSADDVPDNWSLSDRVSYALEIPIQYAHVEGDHHKKWVLDQMIRVLVGPEGYAEFVRLYDEGEDPDFPGWDEDIAAP